MKVPTIMSESLYENFSYRSANFPLFKKLQHNCTSVLNAHIVSEMGTIPLGFFNNCINPQIMFEETIFRQHEITQLYKLQKKNAINFLTEELECSQVHTQYKPVAKDQKHGEYHRINHTMWCLESSSTKNKFFKNLKAIVQKEPSKNEINLVVYILPCEECYKLTESQKIRHKSTLWNIMVTFEKTIHLSTSLCILIDHMDNNFDGCSPEQHQKITQIIQEKPKLNLEKDTMLHKFCLKTERPCKLGNVDMTEMMQYFGISDFKYVWEVMLQSGTNVDEVLSTIYENLFFITMKNYNSSELISSASSSDKIGTE